MPRTTGSGPNRSDLRKERKKKHYVLRTVLLILLVLVVSGTCYGVYKWHELNPVNHFSNLKTISEPAKKTYKQSSGTFNVLLIGSDARPEDKTGHTDSMVLIHADLKTHKYNLLSIPRDSRFYMEGIGYTKLTSVQAVYQAKYGTQEGIIRTVKTISSFTGAPINYYAETNYWGFQDMVDAIGGIDMNLPFDVKLTHPWYRHNYGKIFKAGLHQSLNGEMVTEIVHERYSLPGTDYGRQKLQEAALIGVAKKMMQPANVTRFPALAKSLSKFLVATNLSTDDMISIGLGVKSNFQPDKQFNYLQIQGQDVSMYDDVLKANNDEILLPRTELRQLIEKYFTN
ncbi:MAG: LCP family protein [Sporolactobacillus sp.]